MNFEHTCLGIDEYNSTRCRGEVATVKYYKLGGWEVEVRRHWESESSSVDEIHFCPYCGKDLEKEILENVA